MPATAVREKPILFSGEMVRAILDSRKTVTRRVVKPQPDDEWSPIACERYHPAIERADGMIDAGPEIFGAYDEDRGVKCHYGGPGDRLWVRETWRRPHCNRDTPLKQGQAIAYRATNGFHDGFGDPWRPSIHMPRWASRLTLEITDVRVERLQDITGRDARAEGCEPDWDAFESETIGMDGWDEPEEFVEECEDECDWINYGHDLVHSREHREWEREREWYALRLAFRSLWDSINAKSHPWDANPWVWVVSFKRA